MTARAALVSALREADWATAERTRAWCAVLAWLSLVAVLLWIAVSRSGLDRLGKPLGTDFIGFWAAGRLAADGRAALAYDHAAHMAAELAAFPSGRALDLPFLYPPTFLLPCLLLALLPYLAALALWIATGVTVFVACLRRLLPQRWAVLPILGFPGILVTAGNGQNGFLTASCFGGGMLFLEIRPFLAGLCLGMLAIKPHLALAVPVGLIAARRWRALAGAATAAAGLCALSGLVLGAEAWAAFAGAAGTARATLEQGLLDPAKMQSVFAAVRLLQGPVPLAYLTQVVVAIAACGMLARHAARRPGAGAEGALLVAAALLCTPYLVDYDLTGMALPLAWVTASAQRTVWLPWEKLVLLAAYVLPLVSRPLAMATQVPAGPVVLAALLMIVARRAAA